jgi:murein DD-endopeptidase MepM/ murein hydrolase activator NlpD
MEKRSRLKRSVDYIFSKQLRHYTKEAIKLTNIIAIGILIIIAIILIKMKPVYQISIDGEMIGYIQNKKQFEEIIYKAFNNNEENNIAFADFNVETKYEMKLVNKQQECNEEEVITKLASIADITYFQYAIIVNDEEKQYFSSYDQANEVAESIKNDIEYDTQIYVQRVYTKQTVVKEDIQIADVCQTLITEINEQIQQEIKKEKSTIEGVFIAVVPVEGNITSRYGARESVRNHEHKGLDIAATTGTSIKAAADGTITFSGYTSGYGNLIIIDHGNGITTYYGHCSKLYKSTGATVTAGDIIAAVGSTGNSTGPHLHFEIRKNGEYVDPYEYLF